MSFASAREMPMVRMNRPNLFFWWAKTCSTWARIADSAALARAILCGIGLPAGLRLWMRLTSILEASHFSFFCER